jgi:nucleoside-triphosphatase THEP1
LAETHFETFDLSVLYAGERSGIWLSASSRLGAVHAVPRRDSPLFSLRELADDASWFRQAIDSGTGVPDQAARFGGELRDLVFGVDEIASLFRRTRGAAGAASRPLLVRLLVAPEELAALPWELLVDPDDGASPLVFAPDAHVVRVARDRRYPLRVDPVAPPLNVLLVLSNPSGSGEDDVPFDHYEEGRALLAELQDLIDRGVLLVDVEDRPSIENLRRRIGARERGYHVVHYLGHASPDKLKLEDAAGAPSWVPSEKFNALLRTCQDLRLAFFAGCRTASLAPGPSDEDFTSQLSVADRCVREACQTVVGMQAVLPFRAEQVITRFFYQALCTGTTVARALSLARAAARDDEVLGRDLLNWAVPSLVTGHEPGPIVDPLAASAASPRPKARRAQLKLELAEPDREFFARFSQLREALTVLCRKGPNRVVWVTGAPGSGKSRLLARALDELDESIVAVLYVSALRLARNGDSVEELSELVNELLQRAGRSGLGRDRAWTSEEWWDRLIEELVETSFVLVIDDVDRVEDAAATALGQVVDRLVARVSKARVALAGGDQIRGGFLSEATDSLLSRVHLLTLEPREVSQWVRRNRPALAVALAARTEGELGSIHNRLGFKLHLWARLAEELDRQTVKDLPAAVEVVMSAEAPSTPVAATGPASGSQEPEVEATPTAHGPLRVAIAGPFTIGRQQQFADGISALALAHGAGARVVLEGAPDAGTAVAQLMPVESPFSAEGTTSAREITRWLKQLVELRPDLVLLDYGADAPNAGEEKQLRKLADDGSLLIAAAGNRRVPAWPAWHLFVLAVGALDKAGRREKYSVFFPEAGKPDVYAVGTVAGTAMEGVPDVSGGVARGTSFAALNAVAAATLVWAVDRTMTNKQVAELLRKTAVPLGRGRVRAKRLDLEAALDTARVRLVARALLTGPLDEQAVAAASGLGADGTLEVLEALVKRGAVRVEGGRYVGDTDRLSKALS